MIAYQVWFENWQRSKERCKNLEDRIEQLEGAIVLHGWTIEGFLAHADALRAARAALQENDDQ